MLPRLFLLGLIAFLGPAQSMAAERTLPFTPAEVRCTEMQLERVQRRMTSVGSGQIAISMGTNAIWNASTSGGAFTGLVRQPVFGDQAINDFIAGTEHFVEADMAFSLFFDAKASILDPHKPAAPQATLVRRDTGTSLVLDHIVDNLGTQGPCCIDTDPFNPTCGFDPSCPMILNFDLAPVPGDSVNPLVPLVINSAAAATPEFPGPLAKFLPAASGTGPGISNDRLDQACGGPLTEFDRHVFEILARTILPSACYQAGAIDNCGANAFNLTIFRGADTHLFRVDIYTVEYICDDQGNCYDIVGPLALAFDVNWDGQGRLTTGEVRVLPECRPGQDADCSGPFDQNFMGIFVVPPIFPGHEEEEPAAFHGAPYLSVFQHSPLRLLRANVNWAAILSGTALNQP
jgi:hypothetical protein